MLLGAEANLWHPKGVANQVQRVVCGLIGAEQGLCSGLAKVDTLD